VKLSDIMSTLKQLGAAPRKSLGQNFLHDQNLAGWIVDKFLESAIEQAVEIGPGLGALTQQLIERGLSATLIERDRAFAKFLRERFGSEKVRIIEGDALEYDTRSDFLVGSIGVIGNLPYYASTPLLFHFTREPCPYRRLMFTLQKEVADRLLAGPGTKEYGAISVLLQRRWVVSRIKNLPPSVFFPQPQVDSTVITLTCKGPSDVAPCDAPLFDTLVRSGFGARRKQLRTQLAKVRDQVAIDAALDGLGVLRTVRAEELSVGQWQELTRLLSPKPADTDTGAELLQVVDEQDRPVGTLERAAVHREARLHRAVHVFVLNDQGELFLQKRSTSKDTYPGRWDSSAAGHVGLGESYEACAEREIVEELGARFALKRIGRLEAGEETGFEFIQIFLGRSNGPFPLHPEEIETGGFFPLHLVDRWIKFRPGDFAPGFIACFRLGRETLTDSAF
jgi:16S rRNA (adenine1518-N6/adenine1519-N6)-dimethyltransferase